MAATPPTPKDNTPRDKAMKYITAFAIFWLLFAIFDFQRAQRTTSNLGYGEFLALLDSKKVESVNVREETMQGELKEADSQGRKQFVTARMEDPTLIQRLQGAGVKFEAQVERSPFGDLLSWLLPFVAIIFLWSFLLRRVSGGAGAGGWTGGNPLLTAGKSRARVYAEKDVPTRFTDVAGIDEAKAELLEIVNFLKDPTRYSRLGGRVPKGSLLVGPPGTGKTLVARAVAGEASVPFYSINGSEFVELFVGLGAARVRDLFADARKNAPCIIFIDELDALGKARGISAVTGGANDEKEQTLNQLLAELDGFDPSSGVVLLAATNRPEVLDPALLRSGRFDRQILIDKPDRGGRQAILVVHLKKVKLAGGSEPSQIASHVAAHVAAMTTGFSGADLANLVNEAAIVATRRGADGVELSDFNEAFERIVAGLERRSRALSAEEKKRVAYHEMGHAIVSFAVGSTDAVQKVSVIPRGLGALGYTMRRPTEDRYLMSRREIESKIAMLLGGRAAETEFLKEASTGAADDLDKASEIARAMITRFGMSENLGLATYERQGGAFLGEGGQFQPLPRYAQNYSEVTAREIDDEVRLLLDRQFDRAMRAIRHYREAITEGAEHLLRKETLSETELQELWQRTVARLGEQTH